MLGVVAEKQRQKILKRCCCVAMTEWWTKAKI